MFIKPIIYYYNYVFSPHSDVKERASLAFCALSFFAAPPPPPPPLHASGSGTGRGFRNQQTNPSRPLRKPSSPPQKHALCHTRPRVGPSGAWGLSLGHRLLGDPRWEPGVWLCPHSLLRRQGLELLIKLQAVNSGQIILAS